MISNFCNSTVSYSFHGAELNQLNTDPLVKVKHPGYIFGEWVVRPSIDLTYRLGCSFFNGMKQAGLALDNLVRKTIDIIPTARAYEIECLDSSCKQASFNIPMYSKLTHEQLLEKFEKIRALSGYNQAIVFEARSKIDNKRYALRIGSPRRESELDFESVKREELYQKLQKTPYLHVAKIYSVFYVEQKNYLPGGKREMLRYDKKLKDGHFVHDDYHDDPEAPTYYREVQIMELGSGDFRSESFTKAYPDDSLAASIQLNFIGCSLYEDGIISIDDKDRNYIWKPLDANLKNYKYWHYRFGQYDLYLPAPKVVIKRVDFDGWMTKEEKGDACSDELEYLAKRNEMTIEDLLARYPKPDVTDGEIYHVN